ncbi:MAG: hypothetical protein WKF82_10055 [Nocardioidaceae bacterium]
MSGDGSEVFEGRLPRMVRTQLGELVHENGAEILQDPRRVRAMLGDTISTARREINLISLALSEGVPDRLQAVADDPLRVRAEITALTRQLERNHALHHDAAEWAVRSCAWSLAMDDAPEHFEPAPTLPTHPELPSEPTPSPTSPQERLPLADGLEVPPPTPPPPIPKPEPEPEPDTAVRRLGRSQLWVIAAVAVSLLIGVVIIGGYALTNDSTKRPEASPQGADSSTEGPTGPATSSPSASPESSGTTQDSTQSTLPSSSPSQTQPTRTQQQSPIPPAPFKSAELAAFAAPYFTSGQCYLPDSDEAPVAYDLPHIELVKCGRKGEAYTGTFWCTQDAADFRRDRRAFFSNGVRSTMRSLEGLPAGPKDVPLDTRRAYQHVNDGGFRVYWASRAQLCSAELQGLDDTSGRNTLNFWRTGQQR